jgi:hypothetical protein
LAFPFGKRPTRGCFFPFFPFFAKHFPPGRKGPTRPFFAKHEKANEGLLLSLLCEALPSFPFFPFFAKHFPSFPSGTDGRMEGTKATEKEQERNGREQRNERRVREEDKKGTQNYFGERGT